MRTTPLLWLIVVVVCATSPSRAPAQTCPCDCDGNGRVFVNEMIRAANVALELVPISSCPAALTCTGQRVCIEGLIRCVRAALYGCGTRPTPTHTVTPIASPPPGDTLVKAMQSVLDDTCAPFGIISQSDVAFSPDVITYFCSESPGHDSDGVLRRYADDGAASAAFDELAAGDWQREEFHEFPALFRESSQGGGFFRESLVWRAGCWLITLNSFDDTHFLYISPQPREVAEAINSTALAALLAECPADGDFGMRRTAGGSCSRTRSVSKKAKGD